MRLKVFTSIILLWMMTSIFGQFLYLSPDQIDLHHILAAPNSQQLLGNDELGRPVLDRLIIGARTSFLVALWVVLISSTFGTLLGAFAAYSGGIIDLLLVRIIDIFLAFPGILLAIALAGVMGPGIENVIIALSIVGWVGFARLARAQVLSLKHRDHISAAIVLGQSRVAIIRKHLLPLIIAPLIIETTFGVAGVVIAEAGLSFLGLGVQPPSASWGSMIRDGTRYMLVAPHLVLAPGMCIMLVVLSINMLGDRLRDKMDIKS